MEKEEKFCLPGACSCMTLTSKTGKPYWFRTCDIETDLWDNGAHVIQQNAGDRIEFGNGKTEKAGYGFIGMTYNHQDTWLLDGVNECGLAGGLLMLYEGTGADTAKEDREGYIGMEVVTKVLACCKDIGEVMELADRIQILDIPFGEQKFHATMHYFFVDSTGNEVILEAAEEENPGILKKYPREEILGVMTNSPPYPKQRKNLAWFLSRSPELRQGIGGKDFTELCLDGRKVQGEEGAEHLSKNGTFPASYCSYDRFIRIAVLKALNHCGNEFSDEKMLALGSTIMNTVCEPHTQGVFHYTKIEEDGRVVGQKDSFTQYLIMYDMAQRCFYLKKYDEITWEKHFFLDFQSRF